MNEFLGRAVNSIEMLSAVKKAGVLNHLTARMILSAHSSKNPTRELQQLENVLRISKMFGSPFNKPDASVNGLIGLATSENNQLIGMFPDECHVLIVGQTGTGKTTLLRLIFSQALALGHKVWLFVGATDLRCLLDIHSNILVVKFDGLVKINSFNPCGVSEYENISNFTDTFCNAESVYPGTKNYVMDHLNELNQIYKQYKKWFSIHDLYSYIESLNHRPNSRDSFYRDSARNRLKGLLSGPLGDTFDCSMGHEQSLMNTNCIFEMSSLTSEQQRFFATLMLTKLYSYRVNNENLKNKVHKVGLDDGNNQLGETIEVRRDFGFSKMHELLCTARKSRINIFCCSQTPHQLGSGIHSNSAIKIMFSLANGKDIDYMQKSMGNFSKEQKDYCYTLGKRQVIIKNSQRYPEPIVGIIPEIPEVRQINDAEIEEKNKIILSNFPPVIPRYKPEKKKTETTDKSEVSDNYKEFLWAVKKYQYTRPLTEICRHAGFSAGVGSRIHQGCEKRNLIKIIQIDLRGRPKYPVLMPEAYKILGIKEKNFYGRGAGYEHVLWQHLIAERINNG